MRIELRVRADAAIAQACRYGSSGAAAVRLGRDLDPKDFAWDRSADCSL